MRLYDIAVACGVTETTARNWAKLGCPIDSIESVQSWRAANSKRGRPGDRSTIKPEYFNVETKSQSETKSEPATDSSIEAVLDRTKQTELIAFTALQNAHDAGNASMYKILTENHSKAVKARIDAEAAVIETQKLKGTLLTLDDALARWGAIANNIRTLLDSLPKSIGPRCNPTDPDLAIQALEDWKNNQALKILNE